MTGSRRRSPAPGDDPNAAIQAVQLDAILTDPNAAAIVEGVRARTPTALRDQGDAAAFDLFTRLDRHALRTTGTHAQQLRLADVPDWFRLGLAAEVSRWVNGTVATCGWRAAGAAGVLVAVEWLCGHVAVPVPQGVPTCWVRPELTWRYRT